MASRQEITTQDNWNADGAGRNRVIDRPAKPLPAQKSDHERNGGPIQKRLTKKRTERFKLEGRVSAPTDLEYGDLQCAKSVSLVLVRQIHEVEAGDDY